MIACSVAIKVVVKKRKEKEKECYRRIMVGRKSIRERSGGRGGVTRDLYGPVAKPLAEARREKMKR
jgi:hypothetical protein